MKNILSYILILSTLAFASCIENDIPLPYIKGNVIKFEANGQVESKIDPSGNIISLVLSDTVNIEKARISLMEITKDAKSTLNQGDVVNLLTDTLFDITTYQVYRWRLSVKQPINRHVTVDGQIGDAVIDLKNKKAWVTVAATQSLYDIRVESMQLGPSIAEIIPDPKTISNFSLPQKFIVTYFDKTEEWDVIVVQSVEPVTTGEADPWGTFAYLTGAVQPNDPNEGGFEYRKQGAQEWIYTKGNIAGTKLTAKILGLSPNTTYEYRAKLGSSLAEAKTLTTETTPTIENLSFDNWYKDGKKWYPNAANGNSYWASGNEGVVMAGKESNTVPVEGAEAVKGKAVRMETIDKVMIAKIAAGNIFTGIYKEGMPPKFEDMKKLVIFGRPYSGRPTKMRGWYKYLPKPVNLAADPAFPYTDSIGKMDWAHIYIKLENWGTATDRPAPSAITLVATGEFRTNKETAKYEKFEFNINYLTTAVKPTHVLITATPSINGGDFCGGVGSTLYVDEFELGFD